MAAFPPTYKNGYERLYKFVDECTDWERPSYDIWDPAKIEDWIDELDAMRVRYCVLTDHILDHHEPVTVYRSQSNKPVYTFADRAVSSVRRATHSTEEFRYRGCGSSGTESSIQRQAFNRLSLAPGGKGEKPI